MARRITQTEAILDYMKENKEISSWTAIERFGATRLSDIIFRLKKQGYSFKTERRVVTTRFGAKTNVAVYTLLGGINEVE